MPKDRPKTKILLDGGDPGETKSIKKLLGFLDGQTTNPTYVSKNPEVQERIASGHRFTPDEQKDEYRKIVQQISPLVGDAGVSIEVFADFDTKAEQMLEQGEEMFSWIPNAYIKYPCLHEGLRAAQMSVERGIRVNMTLCFSQEQAAAVLVATKGAREPVYISPFVGRLDDRGDNGMDVVQNIKRMYAESDGHVRVLAASLRRLDHLLYTFALGAELATVPAKLLREWAGKDLVQSGPEFKYEPVVDSKRLRDIPYKELKLTDSWESFDIHHELTDKGIKKFVDDYRNTLQSAA
jgi:transaldolase